MYLFKVYSMGTAQKFPSSYWIWLQMSMLLIYSSFCKISSIYDEKSFSIEKQLPWIGILLLITIWLKFLPWYFLTCSIQSVSYGGYVCLSKQKESRGADSNIWFSGFNIRILRAFYLLLDYLYSGPITWILICGWSAVGVPLEHIFQFNFMQNEFSLALRNPCMLWTRAGTTGRCTSKVFSWSELKH